jgi:hypothetical protein
MQHCQIIRSDPSARVTITETATGISRTVLARVQGACVIPSLRPADYSMGVQPLAFQTFVQKGVRSKLSALDSPSQAGTGYLPLHPSGRLRRQESLY